MLAGDFGQRREDRDVGAAFAELGIDRGQQVALVEGVKDFGRAHELQVAGRAALRRRERGRPAQAEIGQSQPCPRDLAVIGRGILRCHFVIGLGPRVLTQGIGGAALPIAGARQRIGTDGVLAETREQPGGGLRIVQEAQRHPAGGEIMVGAEKTARRRGGVARDPVGGARIAVVEQLAN